MDVNVNSDQAAGATCPHCGMATQVCCSGCHMPVANCTCAAKEEGNTININNA